MSLTATELETPCVEHTLYRMPSGYGTLKRDSKMWLAHRWAWTQAHGTIPDGMCVCHRCDNPPCINVEHLFLGTQADNNHDMSVKGRRRAKPTKITTAQVKAIKQSTESGRVLAARYGVSYQHVSKIRRGLRRIDG